MSIEITPELVDRVVEYLNDPEDTTRVWRGFLFMEENGIDPAIRSGELHAYLTAPDSPLPNPAALGLSDERALVLALRARARTDLGLAPLDDRHRLAWSYQVPKPPVWRPDQCKPQSLARTYRASPEQLARSLEEITAEDGRLIPALLLILDTNQSLSLNSKNGVSWFTIQVHPIIARVFPSLTAIDVHQFLTDLLDYVQSNGVVH